MGHKQLFTAAAAIVAIAALGAGSPAQADPVVHGPFIDENTGGDWRGVYGQCFFLVPDSRDEATRETVGPAWCSADIRQYRYNNCYGGVLFSEDSSRSFVDWRIFRGADDSVEVATWSTDLPVEEGAAQWNPCLNDFRHTTYANKKLDTDSLTVELVLDVKGDVVLAYYFTGAAPKCRELDFSLLVDDVELASGTVGDFASGTYVVFEVEDLKRSPDGTRIALTASDAPGPASCEVSDQEETNVHISGVFLSPSTSMQPNSCNGLTGAPRNHSPRRF
jgi:hypothetical protein